MGWVLRLVETGVDGASRSVDVMVIDRLGNLGDIAALGLTRASSLWLWSNRKSSQPRAGTMRSDGRNAELAPPAASTRITALTGSPPCSVRSRSGCRASCCAGWGGAEAGHGWPAHCRSTPELDQVRAQFSACMPYRVAAGVLEHLLPIDAGID